MNLQLDFGEIFHTITFIGIMLVQFSAMLVHRFLIFSFTMAKVEINWFNIKRGSM